MRYLTDFADQAVILPLVFATAIALAVQGWWWGAAIWLIVVGAAFLATLTFKLMFLVCCALFGPLDVHSPSGHVAAATVVTGGLAVGSPATVPASFLPHCWLRSLSAFHVWCSACIRFPKSLLAL